MTDKKMDNTSKGVMVFIALLLLVVLYNGYRMSNIQESGSNPVSSYDSILPTGIPSVYGAELGVNYDYVSATSPRKADETIRKMATLDQSISLTGNELERYIDVASSISCEYCCGAESIIFSDGRAACGCAHSFAMRGLAKYLVRNHGEEFSDAQILEELGKWKVLFFPEIHMQKASALESQGVELNYINLASNAYRGIEQGATGGMVGGC